LYSVYNMYTIYNVYNLYIVQHVHQYVPSFNLPFVIFYKDVHKKYYVKCTYFVQRSYVLQCAYIVPQNIRELNVSKYVI
jgi:hypothetical protein